MIEGIRYTSDYGEVRLCLRQIMEQRGLNRNQIARKIDVRFEVADKWYHDNVERLDLDILARLCSVLKCQPGDLLVYHERTAETAENAEN